LFLDLQVFNNQKEPQSGVHVTLRNQNNKIVLGFVSDSIGKFPPLIIYDTYIQSINLSFIGYNDVKIATDSLFGKSTKIEVYLEDSSETYTNHVGTYKFLIKHLNADNLELSSLNGGKTLKLKRIP